MSGALSSIIGSSLVLCESGGGREKMEATLLYMHADIDAEVISIETSRSDREMLDTFIEFRYPYKIGPGVYDIHSPAIPSERFWVNPGCGLIARNNCRLNAANNILRLLPGFYSMCTFLIRLIVNYIDN